MWTSCILICFLHTNKRLPPSCTTSINMLTDMRGISVDRDLTILPPSNKHYFSNEYNLFISLDGLISYRISQGNLRKNMPGWKSLRDNGYDGTRLAFGTKVGVLYHGLGQLTDGVIGRNADWNDTGNLNWIDWIGWQDSLTADPSVTFEFSSLRKFSCVRFHVLSLPGHNEKMLFSKVVLSFSRDGEYFAWKTIFEPSMTKRTAMSNRAFWIKVNLEGNIGKHVTCEFFYYGWWVLISEVEFESGNLFEFRSPFLFRVKLICEDNWRV